jgi:hypothetical protein
MCFCRFGTYLKVPLLTCLKIFSVILNAFMLSNITSVVLLNFCNLVFKSFKSKEKLKKKTNSHIILEIALFNSLKKCGF